MSYNTRNFLVSFAHERLPTQCAGDRGAAQRPSGHAPCPREFRFDETINAACRKFFDELGSYADQLHTLLTENFEIAGG
jgi:hypothetical protein